MAELQIAALYMRMSTERQDFSIQHQRHALEAYAAAKQIQIVREYRDEGKSGLALKGREGLQQLLGDVTMSAAAPFNTVLIYDVSRWGRVLRCRDETALRDRPEGNEGQWLHL